MVPSWPSANLWGAESSSLECGCGRELNLLSFLCLKLFTVMFLHRLEYLTEKQERSQDEMEKQILTKQIQEVEHEMNNIE